MSSFLCLPTNFHKKNYNQTTTKRCDICDLREIYHLLSTEISSSCVKRQIRKKCVKQALWPTELIALCLIIKIQVFSPCVNVFEVLYLY